MALLEGQETPSWKGIKAQSQTVTVVSEGQWVGSIQERGKYKEVVGIGPGWVKGQGGVCRGAGLHCHCSDVRLTWTCP